MRWQMIGNDSMLVCSGQQTSWCAFHLVPWWNSSLPRKPFIYSALLPSMACQETSVLNLSLSLCLGGIDGCFLYGLMINDLCSPVVVCDRRCSKASEVNERYWRRRGFDCHRSKDVREEFSLITLFLSCVLYVRVLHLVACYFRRDAWELNEKMKPWSFVCKSTIKFQDLLYIHFTHGGTQILLRLSCVK